MDFLSRLSIFFRMKENKKFTNVFTWNIPALAALKLVMSWQNKLPKYCYRHCGTYGTRKLINLVSLWGDSFTDVGYDIGQVEALLSCMKVVRYSFSGSYLAFSIRVLPTLPYSDRCGNYTSFWRKIKVFLKVFFKVIDISMETINQKSGENWYSMDFVRTRSVIENLMPISEITVHGKGNIQE